MEFRVGHTLSLAEDLLQALALGFPTFPDSGVLRGWAVTCACASASVEAQVCMCVCVRNAKLHLSMQHAWQSEVHVPMLLGHIWEHVYTCLWTRRYLWPKRRGAGCRVAKGGGGR